MVRHRQRGDVGLSRRRRRRALAWRVGLLVIVCATSPARAQNLREIARDIVRMQRELQSQRDLIKRQASRIDEQQREIALLQGRAAPAIASTADRPRPPVAAAQTEGIPPSTPAAGSLPDQAVGAAPQLARVEQQTQAVPEGFGVLTRAGHIVLEPSAEYTTSSSNRLVFRGIELIPGIQIGQIDAGTADRDTLVATATARYGLTDRLEVEARVPYLYRSDRTKGIQQRDDTTQRAFHVSDGDLGDVEFGLRYQINRPTGERPIFVGSLRVKTDTGRSPFAVPFDDAGVATGLATGSGFWAVQPGLSFLLPSEPAVIFGGVSYLHNIPRDIDRTVGSTVIGHVDPGDAIGANLGFGFALNPRFSFSLGYEHTYIMPMRWVLDGVVNRSSRLQVGSLLLGMSYRLTPRKTLNFGVDVGATRDAPDVSVVVRLPFSLD